MTARRKSPKRYETSATGVGRGMRRAARTAREVARMHGTPMYVWENGKVVAKDPNDETKEDMKMRGEFLAECPGFSGRFFLQNQLWVTPWVTRFSAIQECRD
jgi:hypothetical protein